MSDQCSMVPSSVASRVVLRGWLMAAVVGVAAALALPLPVRASTAVALPDFSELVEQVGPSVVNIRTVERGRPGHGVLNEIDPNIEEFFRRFGIPMPGAPEGRRRPREDMPEPMRRGVGSGFILSADGYVMTNAHVVAGADEVMVTLTDKREFKAKIVGSDRRTDVAVVKIDATGLPTVRIGDVSRLRVGQWVLAIGSPFGLDNTVTAGIVSAKQRDTGEYLPFIQTDVAINPGNSGGPLLNLAGEVVGINSQIYSRSGGFMGISFAIPIDEAMRVADQLRSSGRVVRGRIGVQIGPVSDEVAEAIGLGKARGALVQSVEKDGPAAKGGVEAGDVIVEVDGKPVGRFADLPRLIGGTSPGSRSVLKVHRRGQSKSLTVTVGEFEAEVVAAKPAAGTDTPVAKAMAALGMTVSNLSDAQRRELGVRAGVQVDAVEGAAARAGLREGDVILALGPDEVRNAEQFAKLAQRLDRERPVSVLVRRGDWTNYLVIRPQR